MNNLSWFLYFADVVGGIGAAAGSVIIVTAIVSLLCIIHSAVEEDLAVVRAYKWPALSTILVATLLVVFTPSKTTIYAIAASEMGEEAIQSKTGGKALKALDAWLDLQIEGEPEAE